jgi:hypothetical protein
MTFTQKKHDIYHVLQINQNESVKLSSEKRKST